MIHVLQVRVPRAAAVRGKVAAHLNGLEADIAVLRRLQHPNIVRYLVRMPTQGLGKALCAQMSLQHLAHSNIVRYLVRALGRCCSKLTGTTDHPLRLCAAEPVVQPLDFERCAHLAN